MIKDCSPAGSVASLTCPLDLIQTFKFHFKWAMDSRLGEDDEIMPCFSCGFGQIICALRSVGGLLECMKTNIGMFLPAVHRRWSRKELR